MTRQEKPVQKDYDHFVKVVIVGDSAVGKTNFLLRFVNGQYTITHITTIGIDFKVKTLTVRGKRVKMQLWDTAGQDRFRTITKTYYRGSAGIVLVYSVTDRKSFSNIEAWINQLEQHGPEGVNKIIVGNKIDCPSQERQVTKEEGEELAAKYGVKYIQASAKENVGVAETFQSLAGEITERLDKAQKLQEVHKKEPYHQKTQQPPPVPQVKQPQTFQLKGAQKKTKSKKSCC